MSIFENMDAKEIAMCLSRFYEEAQEWKRPRVSLMSTQIRLPNRNQPITLFRSDFDEGIKILREDYDVFWTPDTKPDDLKWKINKRRMKELDERIAKNSYLDTDSVYGRMVFGPGCVVTGNDYLYRRELGLPDNATVADILKKIKGLKQENNCLVTSLGQMNGHYHAMLDALDCKTVADNVGALNKVRELMAFKRDASRLVDMGPSDGALAIFEHLADRIHSLADISKERDEADRLRRHWHSKYEKEHEECVRLSKLHAADKEKKDKQDAKIRDLSNQNTTLGYSVAALKKRIRSMEAEAAEKETKNKVIIDSLRDNLVDSIEECKKLNGVTPLKDPLDSDS